MKDIATGRIMVLKDVPLPEGPEDGEEAKAAA